MCVNFSMRVLWSYISIPVAILSPLKTVDPSKQNGSHSVYKVVGDPITSALTTSSNLWRHYSVHCFVWGAYSK